MQEFQKNNVVQNLTATLRRCLHALTTWGFDHWSLQLSERLNLTCGRRWIFTLM